MLEGALGGFVGFLAVLGVGALALRLFGAVGRFVLRAAEIAAASGMAEASTRRGDITALGEARAAIERARWKRRRQGLMAVAWGAWLVLPLVTRTIPEAWALAAPLWLLPNPPASRGTPPASEVATSDE